MKMVLSKLSKVCLTGVMFLLLVHVPTMIPGSSVFWAGLLIFALAILSLRELGVYSLVDKWFNK